MSTGYTAYLQKGSKRINLGAAPYALGLDFVPPSITETPNIASGTSANQYGGSKLISKKVESSWYTFSVRVLGTTSNPDNGGAIEGNIKRLDNFIRSGTTAEPVYFCWKADNNVSFEPTIGWWGSTFRAEIITGDAKKSMSFYWGSDLRERGVFADLSLLINPPEWPRRLLAGAKGGIIEDTFGTADGSSRGVILGAATTNIATNPIFGAATYSTGWDVTNAALLFSLNTDKEYVLFGERSVLLVNTHASTTYAFKMALTAADTSTHAVSIYLIKPDKSAVTSDDIQVDYAGTGQTTTITAIGNGFYRAHCTMDGIASAQHTGIFVKAGKRVYICGMQFEDAGQPSWMCYGDMLGCSWASTAHASASTRVAPALNVPITDQIRNSEFTATFVVKHHLANTQLSRDFDLFDDAANDLRLYYDYANNRVVFTDGTNAANGTANTFAAGDVKVYHAVASQAGGLVVYINGASAATNATYTPAALPASLYVGSYSTATNQIPGSLMGATFSNRAMTAAEVLADYTARASAAAADLRIDWLPYIWTADGDGVLDGCIDADHDGFGVISSVPGSMDAKTEYEISPSTVSKSAYWLMSTYSKEYIIPTAQWYYDLGDVEDATASGGLYDSISTSGYALGTVMDTESIIGNYQVFLRIKASSAQSGTTQKPGYTYTSANYIIGNTTKVSLATTYQWLHIGAINVSSPQIDPDYLTIQAVVYITSGAAAAAYLDYFMFAERALYIANTPTAGWDKLIINGSEVMTVNSGVSYNIGNTTGDKIDAKPSSYTYVYFVIGGAGDVHAITDTATLNAIFVTPRWALA